MNNTESQLSGVNSIIQKIEEDFPGAKVTLQGHDLSEKEDKLTVRIKIEFPVSLPHDNS